MKLTVCSDHKTCHTGGWDTGIDESEMPSTALRSTAMGLHNRRKTIFHLNNNKEYIWRFCCQVIYLSSQTCLCLSGVASCHAGLPSFLLKLIFTPKLCFTKVPEANHRVRIFLFMDNVSMNFVLWQNVKCRTWQSLPRKSYFLVC